MKPVKAAASKLIANPWVLLVLIILLLLLALWVYRNGKRWWAQATRVDQGNYDNPKPNDEREGELKRLAQDLYGAMDGATIAATLVPLLHQTFGLNDTELRYTAEHFVQVGDGDSLATWINDEWLPGEDIDTKLIARLNNMALS